MQLWGKKEGFQILVFVACSCHQLPANACLGSLLFLNIPFPRFWPKKKEILMLKFFRPGSGGHVFAPNLWRSSWDNMFNFSAVAPASHTSGKGKISLGETPRRSKPIRAPCHALLAALHHTFHDVVWQLHCWVILSQLQCTQTQTQAHQSYQGLSCLSIIYSPGIPPRPSSVLKSPSHKKRFQ